ncbi:MAG: hypothetical protein IKM08_09755, partial [Clostridia bacterium]|nr:hypothetical protein [Clostridia bacterium]
MSSLTAKGNYLVIKICYTVLLLLCVVLFFFPTIGLKSDYGNGTASAYISTFDWLIGEHTADVMIETNGKTTAVGRVDVIAVLFEDFLDSSSSVKDEFFSILVIVLVIAIPLGVGLGLLLRRSMFKKMPPSKKFYLHMFEKFGTTYKILSLIPFGCHGLVLGWALANDDIDVLAFDRMMIFFTLDIVIAIISTVFEHKVLKQLKELEQFGDVPYNEIFQFLPYAAQGKSTTEYACVFFENKYGKDWAQVRNFAQTVNQSQQYYGQPQGYAEPQQYYGQPQGYAEPQQYYGQPQGYTEPQQYYGQPQGYAEPQQYYGQPQGYAEPQQYYGQPQGYAEPQRFYTGGAN